MSERNKLLARSITCFFKRKKKHGRRDHFTRGTLSTYNFMQYSCVNWHYRELLVCNLRILNQNFSKSEDENYCLFLKFN